MNKLSRIALFVFAATFAFVFAESSAHASFCVPPTWMGEWLTGNNVASFPGNQNAWYVGAIRIEMRCVDASEENCWWDGDEQVCSTTSAVRPIYRVSVGEYVPSFTGPGDIIYHEVVDAAEGGDGWRYADTTVSGHPMRTWFRVLPNGKIQAVFEAWVNGNYHGPHWRDLSRRTNIIIRKPIEFPFELAN